MSTHATLEDDMSVTAFSSSLRPRSRANPAAISSLSAGIVREQKPQTPLTKYIPSGNTVHYMNSYINWHNTLSVYEGKQILIRYPKKRNVRQTSALGKLYAAATFSTRSHARQYLPSLSQLVYVAIHKSK